jgi:hypothetical protein
MTAITVSVGGHSRRLSGTRALALGLALAAFLVAAGLVAGRWTAAPASATAPASTTVTQADSGAQPAFDDGEPRCRVRTPC